DYSDQSSRERPSCELTPSLVVARKSVQAGKTIKGSNGLCRSIGSSPPGRTCPLRPMTPLCTTLLREDEPRREPSLVPSAADTSIREDRSIRKPRRQEGKRNGPGAPGIDRANR